jgi:high frequency lysogenization protein
MSINQQSIDQTIALAGVAQSIKVVQNIAWKGQTSTTDFKAVIASLLKLDAESAIAIYGGSFELSSGLRLLKQQLDTNNKNKDPEFISIAINLITLHKQLNNQQSIMDNLSQFMTRLSTTYSNENFHTDDDLFNQLLSDCSNAYQQTVSKLPNRIQVKGEPKYLKPMENQIQVRAALLCAIRSLFLWRQSGGSRWQFLFKKKVILESVNYLLKSPQKT